MTAFWIIPLFSFVEADRRFKGAYCLHHHGDEISNRYKILKYGKCWNSPQHIPFCPAVPTACQLKAAVA
jgi:hypothetical protein